MPFMRIEGDKDNHVAELMSLSLSVDGIYGAVCPKCDAYKLLSEQQAATGQARCFGEVILLSWHD